MIAEISEKQGRLSAIVDQKSSLRLHRINRIRTIQGSLAIEGNTLSEEQITAVLEGKPVIAPPSEVQEARNAILAYFPVLSMILKACHDLTPQVAPQATPQVSRLIPHIKGEMTREELMQALSLKDPKNFRQHYLLPALSAGLIEMTQPDRPRVQHRNTA